MGNPALLEGREQWGWCGKRILGQGKWWCRWVKWHSLAGDGLTRTYTSVSMSERVCLSFRLSFTTTLKTIVRIPADSLRHMFSEVRVATAACSSTQSAPLCVLITSPSYRSKDRFSRGQRHHMWSFSIIKSLRLTLLWWGTANTCGIGQTRTATAGDRVGAHTACTHWRRHSRNTCGRWRGNQQGKALYVLDLDRWECWRWWWWYARRSAWSLISLICSLLKEEMRRVKVFFTFQVCLWNKITSNARKEGHCQAAIRQSILSQCEVVWKDIPRYMTPVMGAEEEG